jgi:hypothetical protein
MIKDKKTKGSEIAVDGNVNDSVIVVGDNNYRINLEGQVVDRDIKIEKKRKPSCFFRDTSFREDRNSRSRKSKVS